MLFLDRAIVAFCEIMPLNWIRFHSCDYVFAVFLNKGEEHALLTLDKPLNIN